MSEEREFETRKKRIDVALKKAGWDVTDKSKVLEEVDTKNSDFNAQIYKYLKDTLTQKGEKAYADYVLLDGQGNPLAVVEAKKASKDAPLGKKQAEMYVDDIKKNYSKDVLIFYTNGIAIWYWNKGYEPPRSIEGYPSQSDLERIRFQNISKKSFLDVPIDDNIAGRDYQQSAIKRITEGIDDGKRKFLVALATGTGKTRVAMALIDVLLRANRAQRVLFLTDRTELNDQAFDENIVKFFPSEPKQKVYSATVDQNSRIYAATLQTMKNNYLDFSVGFFDVIISDEAHRSIFDKYGRVLTYFDAIQVGLTATPTKYLLRHTYTTFGCKDDTPTASFDYEQAVPKYLAPYSVYPAQTHFQIKGINPEDIPEEEKQRLMELYGLDWPDMIWDGGALETKVTAGSNKAWIEEFMDNCFEDDTGLPAKTIFFPVSIAHAYRIAEEFDKLYPQYNGELVQVITHEDRRKKQLIQDFKKKSLPRIAISVGILDTGVDIPEVCNLVFVRPIRSPERFLQMIGRGTRHNDICENREWLPNGKKESFLIFDFCKNFDHFEEFPLGKPVKHTEAVPTKIFLNRLKLYKEFSNRDDTENMQKIKQKIIQDIDDLDDEAPQVNNKIEIIEKTKQANFWEEIGHDPIKFLKKEIAPLIKHKKFVILKEQTFISNCEKYIIAKLENESIQNWWEEPEVEQIRDRIASDIRKLPTTLPKIAEKIDTITSATTEDFWIDTKHGDLFQIIEELGPLMSDKRVEEQTIIEIDIDDHIAERGPIKLGPGMNEVPFEDYLKNVERRVRELAETHPVIQKIKNNEVLTEKDIQDLSDALYAPELYISEENLQSLYNKPKGEIVEFIKHILGLVKLKDRSELIDEAFRSFIVQHNFLSADQIDFIRALQTVFERKHHVEKIDLYEAPFTNLGSTVPTPMFMEGEVDDMIELCSFLEKEVIEKR
jgi:type I restriction enzyme, R subunit